MDEYTELRRSIEFFTGFLLVDRSSKNMCFAVCSPVQSYLSMIGHETKLIKGEINIGSNTHEHIWLQLENGDIIDPTADQFNDPNGKEMPRVYIGEKPKWYK